MKEFNNIKIDKINNIAILYFFGNIEENITKEIQEIIDEYLKNNIKKFIFDFSNLNFIVSSGFGSIVSSKKIIDLNNAEIIISGLNGVIEKLFKISALDKIFEICSDVENAIQKMEMEKK